MSKSWNRKQLTKMLFHSFVGTIADFSIVLKNVEECRKRKLTKYKKSDKIDIISKEKTKENNH